MGELTTALAEAVTSRDVVEAVAQYVLPPCGADGLVFQILEGGRLNVVGAAGYPQEFLSLLDSHSCAARTNSSVDSSISSGVISCGVTTLPGVSSKGTAEGASRGRLSYSSQGPA
jgi:hypothetical protein